MPDEEIEFRRVRRRSKRWRRRQTERRLKIAGGIALGVIALGALQIGLASWQLQVAAWRVTDAQTHLSHGDVTGAREATSLARRAATRSRWIAEGPHLWVAGRLPLVGSDVQAVRTVAKATRELTGPVADELFELRVILDPERIRPVDGRVDLAPFHQAAPHMRSVADRVSEVHADLAAKVNARRVMPLLRPGVLEASTQVARLQHETDFAAGVLEITPAMLGAEGRRTYLVAFQNNAEFRSTGGIPGAFAVIDINKGAFKMREQGAGQHFGGGLDEPVLPQTEEEDALFGDKLGRFVQNVNLTPDWSRSAELLAAMWDRSAGRPVDGIFSVDPVALAHVLRGTGAVALPDGKVATAETAVPVLLNETYLDYNTQLEQDLFFEESARRIFEDLTQGVGDAGEALRGLYQGAREGRGYVWLADADEQARILPNMVAGSFASGDPNRPEVGVYLIDNTGTKLDYYLTSRTDVTRISCRGGGQQLQVQTHISSAVPADQVHLFPALLLGAPVPNAPEGSVLLSINAYGPPGSTISDPLLDGDRGAPAELEHEGRPVVARTLIVEPGQQVTLGWTMDVPQTGAPRLRTTPGAWSSGVGHVERHGCE
ncbi:DUF4012 domain-containing protein [Nocardioides limicola]|uniref:DUF4012 domain-containing protein n=1 Tax=Nocardioides limicola TaxID=2803368 RepID=UPI00193B42E7|nr:DUF4012 domain-containing protein [Nocardioides sp. DJM-14]